MLDICEVERHKLIVKYCKLLSPLLYERDGDVTDILESSKNYIDKVNTSEFRVLDISDIENGRWLGSCTKILIGRHYTSKFKYEINKKNDLQYPYDDSFLCEKCQSKSIGDYCPLCQAESDKRFDSYYQVKANMDNMRVTISRDIKNTQFPDYLREKYVYLLRRNSKDDSYFSCMSKVDYEKAKTIEKAIKDAIKIEVISIFQNQNQNQIQDYEARKQQIINSFSI
jgi:hypothetical protein